MTRGLKVLQPAKLGSLELRNRLVVPPMVTFLGGKNGEMTDALIGYGRERAKGGFGLFVLEATYVDPGGKGFARGVGIDSDDKIAGLKKFTDAIHMQGGKASVQLHHAGRETSSAITGSMILAPSSCPVCYSDEETHELNEDEINEIVARFASGARRARESGFDAVMIHGAHGYLLTQFLSPYTNKRTDKYGGPIENRLRISQEIIRAIRKEIGDDFPVTYRLTIEEGIPGGLTLQEGCAATAILAREKLDCIHVVAGNYATNNLIVPPYPYGSLANKARLQAAREAVGPDFPLAVSGRVTNVYQAEALYEEGLANFVAMGRASIADPELPLRSLKNTSTVRSCIGCNDGCLGRTAQGLPISCALNPLTGHESEYEDGEKPVSKKVLVIGGGPGGMEAAWLAARRGHRVILCEKNAKLGGQFLLAAYPPLKNDIFTYISHMEKRLEEEHVDIRKNFEADVDFVIGEKPDAVFLATGGTPIRIPVPGLEDAIPAQDILRGKLDSLGRRVAVIGGGLVGCEVAEYVAETGREVEIFEMLPRLAGDLYYTVRNSLLERLETLKVALHANSKVSRVESGRIVHADASGEEKKSAPVDSIILALGVKPADKLGREMEARGIEFTRIGDCAGQGNCRRATRMALTVSRL